MKDTLANKGWSQTLVPLELRNDCVDLNGLNVDQCVTRELNTNFNNKTQTSARQKRIEQDKSRLSSTLHHFAGTEHSDDTEMLLFKIYQKLLEFKHRLADEDKEGEIRSEWQQASMVLDRLMFIVFSIATFFIILTMYNQVPYYPDAGQFA